MHGRRGDTHDELGEGTQHHPRKNLVGVVTKDDVFKLFEYIDILEEKLDDSDFQDTFGTEGWRRYFGVGSD